MLVIKLLGSLTGPNCSLGVAQASNTFTRYGIEDAKLVGEVDFEVKSIFLEEKLLRKHNMLDN